MSIRRFILYFIGIIFLGSLAMFMPNFLSVNNEGKEVEGTKAYEIDIQEIGSNRDTIEVAEIEQDEREPELFSSDQMYFYGIEPLYKLYKVGEIEYIKEKVQFYISQNIDPNIIDCSLVNDSIKVQGNITTFSLAIENVKEFTVKIESSSIENVLKIELYHTLSE